MDILKATVSTRLKPELSNFIKVNIRTMHYKSLKRSYLAVHFYLNRNESIGGREKGRKWEWKRSQRIERVYIADESTLMMNIVLLVNRTMILSHQSVRISAQRCLRFYKYPSVINGNLQSNRMHRHTMKSTHWNAFEPIILFASNLFCNDICRGVTNSTSDKWSLHICFILFFRS